MDKDYYSVTVDQVYELSKKIFLHNGIEVISKDLVGNHEIYKDFEFAEEKKIKGYTGGMFKDSVVKRGMKRSTTGLGLFPAGLKLIKVEKNLPKLAHDLGADAAVRILFYIDKGKKGVADFELFQSIDKCRNRCSGQKCLF